MEDINFHFDPLCPWAWLTSRWMARLEELGEVKVNWRLFSLGVVHLEKGEDPVEAYANPSGAALRALVLARRLGGNQLIGDLYGAIGRAAHGRGGQVSDLALVTAAMAEVGMDAKDAAAQLDDPELWDEVVADHLAAVASCQAFGVPTLILDGGAGPGAFGPVITRVPDDQEARELLSDTVRMIRREYLYEMKRDREGHPAELAAIV